MKTRMSTTRISPRSSPACALVSRTENRIPSLVRAHRQDPRRASTPSNPPPPPIPYTITSFCLSLTHTHTFPSLPLLLPSTSTAASPSPLHKVDQLVPILQTSRCCCCCGARLHAACLPAWLYTPACPTTSIRRRMVWMAWEERVGGWRVD